MLKKAKAQFLAKLASFGLEDNIVVANLRKPRADAVGYYSSMSQFRSKPRIVVNVDFIEKAYISRRLMEEEILLTICHEWAHCAAEAIRVLPRITSGSDRFDVPVWQAVFANDEELFAEDFARYCVTYDSHQEAFWDVFIPRYVIEFKRVFIQE